MEWVITMSHAFLKLHTAILLAGFTGIIGKQISVNEGTLVWFRMALTAVIFFAYLRFRGQWQPMPVKDAAKICLVGAILALHWLFFYASIKTSNVSIAVVCFSLVGFFTAVFEPFLGRKRLAIRDVLFSLLTVLGVGLIFHFDAQHRIGIALGVIAAALCAVFTIVSKRVGVRHSSASMLLYEMIGGVIVLSLILPIYMPFMQLSFTIPSPSDWILLLILSGVCTILMLLLELQALREISAFTVNLSFNLEPVYSIVLAMIIFHENRELGPSFYFGLLLIILSVALQTLCVLRESRALKPLNSVRPQ